MRLRPILDDPAVLVDAVAESLDQPLVLHGDLDVDVYRLERSGDEPDLVARVFGPVVGREMVDAVATVLQRLAETPFPAERCVSDDPVLAIGNSRHVLVTEYVPPTPPPHAAFMFAWCTGLLARLANRPGDDLPAGGGWHRLGPTPSREIDAALALGGQVGPSVAEVVDALADADDGDGLPEAMIHADLSPPNAVPRGDKPPVIIDWIGVGRGPRIWPLAFLLYVAGPRGARRALDRYTETVPLTEEERDRLPAIMIARPLTLDLWSVGYERLTPRQAITRCRSHRARVAATITAITAG